MRKDSIAFAAVILIFLCFPANAQKQLLLLKKGKILHRFYPGDDIYIKIKGNPDRIHSYVNNILDNAVVLHHDTIPFHQIERTYIYESGGRNAAGTTFVGAGVILFLIQLINQGEIDSGVTIVSGALVGVGLPMMLIKKKSQVLSYKYRLLMVKAGDPLYR
jgi:hypothetical protein